MRDPTPDRECRAPRLAGALVRLLLPKRWAEEILGDLRERLTEESRSRGRLGGRLWYWRQVLSPDTVRLALELRGGSAARGGDPNPGGTMREMTMELRRAGRVLIRRPTFALAVIATLGLGIGAATAIFSVFDATLLHPLPLPHPERIDVIREVNRDGGFSPASYLDVLDWRTMNRSYDAVSLYRRDERTLRSEHGARHLVAETVSPEYLTTILGVTPALGRTFGPDDVPPGDAYPILLGHDLWVSHFGADPAVAGRLVNLGGRDVRIAGVLPEGFRGVSLDAEVWLPPASLSRGLQENRGFQMYQAVGLRSAGVTEETARADLEDVAARLRGESGREWTIRPTDLAAFHLGTIRPVLVLLLAAVLLTVGIALVNVTALQLARSLGRRRELAVQRALGAGRLRMLRAALLEGAVLAGLGGALGLVLAVVAVQGLLPLVPEHLLPPHARMGPSRPVFVFVLGLIGVACVVFGVAPALGRTRGDLAATLRSGSTGSLGSDDGRRGVRLQRLLVAGELALALAVVFGTAVMVRSLRAKLAQDPGFRSDGVLMARIDVPAAYGDTDAWETLVHDLIEHTEALPGVESAAVGSDAPLRELWSRSRTRLPDGSVTAYFKRRVSPGYFEVLGIDVLQGRSLGPEDGPGGAPVAVVSRSLADRFWPGEAALGQTVRYERDTLTVVGVVEDVRIRELDNSLTDGATTHNLYVPASHSAGFNFDLLVRVRSDPGALIRPLRDLVRGYDPDVVPYRVETMRAALARETAAERLASTLLGIFGVLALVLAAVGTYGVTAFVVGTRTRELAVRTALGAAPSSVRWMVLRDGLVLGAAGLAVGALLAWAGSPFLARIAWGVDAFDIPSLLTAGSLLLAVTLAANHLPAVRATRVDPSRVLRSE